MGLDIETHRGQAIHDIGAVETNMVALAEHPESLLRCVDTRILDGGFDPNWNDDQCPARVGKNAVDFRHGATIVRNVL